MNINLFANTKLNPWLIIAAISGVVLLSWYYMVFAMTMNMEPVASWQLTDILMLFVMWSIMMIGMMLPSATPVILLINKLNQQRKTRQAPFTHTLFFISGYLLAWIFYSALITLIQWWLHHLSILSAMMISANHIFSGILLLIAGLYQWTPYKQKCLQLCRSPLSLLTTQWQEGINGAIRLGFKHGQYCLGCCWFLMALLFVTGVMNLKWIFILTLLVLVEKCLPKGDVLGNGLGILLVLLGINTLIFF